MLCLRSELCRGMVGFAASGPNTRTQQLCLFLGVLAKVYLAGVIHTVLESLGCFQRTVEIAEESKTMVSCPHEVMFVSLLDDIAASFMLFF